MQADILRSGCKVIIRARTGLGTFSSAWMSEAFAPARHQIVLQLRDTGPDDIRTYSDRILIVYPSIKATLDAMVQIRVVAGDALRSIPAPNS